MKKTYINPKMEIVILRHQQQLMAGSPGSRVLDGSGSPITDPGSIGSRGYYYDDEE